MTMISEPDVPAIELGQPEPTLSKPSRARTIGAIAVGAALVTTINVTAAVYLYRGVNDLRQIEARLGQLGQFEQRIGARIDTVNNGFQSRFETLDRQLQASFGQINGNLVRLEQSQPAAVGAEMPRAPQPAFAGTTMAEASTGENGDVPPRMTAPPGPNPAYQRIQQADGKVYYKKIN
ncbi:MULTISPECIES: hypothetical protein [unclassified Mesorhizobium]|uniref:hypothetical protein n=1 Tax=unclassified Mesorhizobium TaxID=325217 RepID=UPI000BB09683|nr:MULTISPECIES: hypothetical protein [unclassified Mesorhizobium]PBB85170.1 hypothetical protein CK216_20105 [Mesorhizobium sp. WSM3876]RWB66612.1 MAG: hypothetical protein EOQ49_28415 [Mesorhizobium sp.]RWB83321.1 MAG: hypothetical protein EOQ52_27060 [Mesorhizobium sp.]RWE33916.1 MAG: hypothetical protein EOS77_10980 [Mesorhizobium sp.]TGS64969.1 hypothetical protein EN844_19990 [Mesorhizobium sp. M3A.F.Ca.ET.201.01.1.1]